MCWEGKKIKQHGIAGMNGERDGGEGGGTENKKEDR